MKNSRKTKREIEKVFGGGSEVTTLHCASLLILLNDIYNGVTGRGLSKERRISNFTSHLTYFFFLFFLSPGVFCFLFCRWKSVNTSP